MNFGIWELLIILIIVALLFGTTRIRSIGGDLGSALKSFRKAVKDTEDEHMTLHTSDKKNGNSHDKQT